MHPWRTWHKVTLGIIVGLALLVLLCAGAGALIGRHPIPRPGPATPGTTHTTTYPSPTYSAGPPTPDPTTLGPTSVPTLSIQAKEAEPASAYYANCKAARAAGAAPLHRGEPGYRSALDRDGDGTACE